MEDLSENLISALAHLEMAKESMLQSNKSYHLRMANMLANGEPIDADEIDLCILSIKLKTMARGSEELISQLKIIVDKYDTQDDNVLKILLNYREELKEIRLRTSDDKQSF
jgi:hypothetical protein